MRNYDPRQDSRWGMKYPLSNITEGKAATWLKVNLFLIGLLIVAFGIFRLKSNGLGHFWTALFF